MFGEWVFAVAVLALLLCGLWLVGTLQSAVPSQQNAVLVGVVVLLGLCIFSAREILGAFVDLGSFGF